MRVPFPGPPLSGDGVISRCPEPADVAWITAACSDRELSRHVPAIPYPYQESDARAFVEHAVRDWAEGTAATFIIGQEQHGAGGVIRVAFAASDPGLAQVGYWLRAGARGRGAATAAVRLTAAWAFGELGIQRLSLLTAPQNQASQRVAERAGFTREGLLRAWLPTSHGRWDSIMFSLLPDDPGARL
jgi:RimJ/RimL family protein N-acetyltransferase